MVNFTCNLTGLREIQITGETLCLDMSEGVHLKEISI